MFPAGTMASVVGFYYAHAMTTTYPTSLSLSDDERAAMQRLVERGRAKSLSEVMRNALARYLEDERLTEELNQLLEAREKEPLVDHDTFWAGVRADIAQRRA